MVREQLRDHDLSPHQKDSVWRILQSGSTLLANGGRSGEDLDDGRRGHGNAAHGTGPKPMFVVPNHLVEQWGGEFLKLYPQALLFIAGDRAGPLLPTTVRRTGVLTDRPMTQSDAWRMVQRRARDAGIPTAVCNHTFLATGITAYLDNGGSLENAQAMAAHESPDHQTL